MNTSSLNIYTINPGSEIAPIRFSLQRGDSNSLVFIGVEKDKDTPFNFGVYESFKCQLRVGSALNKTVRAELNEDDFLLGQSQNALDYESDNSLPPKSIYDELTVFFRANLLNEELVRKLLMDVQATEGLNVVTLGSGVINLNYDVSR
jgi:hypothetical protein